MSTLFRTTKRNSIPRALALVASLGAIAAHAETVIPATDPAVTAGLSPYNWVVKDGMISSAGGGSSLALNFKGMTGVDLIVDTSALTMASSRYPVIAWSVNGGKRQVHQLAPGETHVPLTVSTLNPKLDLYLMGFSPFENRFNGDHPLNSVCITGFRVADNVAVSSGLPASPVWINLGDSILSGDGANGRAGQGKVAGDTWATIGDARASYGYLLAQHYGYIESRIAYGGDAWHGGLASIPSVPALIRQITSTVSRLQDGKLNPAPGVILINLGQNATTAPDSVADSLQQIRDVSAPTTKIIVMIPVSGKARQEVTAGFTDYQKRSNDKFAYLVDLGHITYSTVDGCHPTAAGHQAIYRGALRRLDSILHGQSR